MFYIKEILLLGIVYFIINNLFVFAQPNLDQIFEWNHIPLQSDLDSLKNLKYSKTVNYLQVYIHTQEIKNFEGIDIEQVRYHFYNKKLHSITIKTKENAEQAELLLAWLNLMFGEGKQIGFAPRYFWKGKQTEIHYDKNIITHQVEWKIIDNTIQKEYEKFFKKM